MYSPHHCVGVLFFAWILPFLLLRPSAAPPSQLITAPLLTPHLSQHNSSTSITSLFTAQLITAPLLTPHLSHLHFSHHLSHHHSSQLHFSHLLLTPHSSYYHGTTHHSSVVSRLPFSWQVQCGCLLRGRRSTQSCQVELRRAWSPLGRGCLSCGRLIITTHHSSTYHITTSHHNSSQLITAPLLAGTLLITSHRPTSHHNSSQLITSQPITVPLLTPHFSHLTYHITTSHHNLSHPNHSSTSHTWNHKSTSHTSLLTSPRSSH